MLAVDAKIDNINRHCQTHMSDKQLSKALHLRPPFSQSYDFFSDSFDSIIDEPRFSNMTILLCLIIAHRILSWCER